MARMLISSGNPYETTVGFSRAVRVGNHISIAGTAPVGPDGQTVGIGDAAAQMRRCLEIAQQALDNAGSGLKDVVRVRVMLTNINDWERVAKGNGEYFGDIRPALAIMQVTAFVNPEWLVEIEADVIVDTDN